MPTLEKIILGALVICIAFWALFYSIGAVVHIILFFPRMYQKRMDAQERRQEEEERERKMAGMTPAEREAHKRWVDSIVADLDHDI